MRGGAWAGAHEGERHEVRGFVKACRAGEFPMRAADARSQHQAAMRNILARVAVALFESHPLNRAAVRLLLEKPTRHRRRVGGDFCGDGVCDVTWPSRQLSVVIERKRAMGLSWQQGPLSPGRVGRLRLPGPLVARLLYAEPLRRRMRACFDRSYASAASRPAGSRTSTSSNRRSLLWQARHSVRIGASPAVIISPTRPEPHGRIRPPGPRSRASAAWYPCRRYGDRGRCHARSRSGPGPARAGRRDI
jgi:hypothetical protein